MLDAVNLPLILSAAFIGAASPGPATLSIAGTSMQQGRATGLALAAGITTGSLTWSLAAAFGLGAIMLANAWAFEVLRYFGAAYLLYLAWKSARTALGSDSTRQHILPPISLRRAYSKGLMLHLTNPKAILFIGSLYAVGVPATASPSSLLAIVAIVCLQSALIFHGYAMLFSIPRVAGVYVQLRRWFEGVFAVAFGAAGLSVLTTKIG